VKGEKMATQDKEKLAQLKAESDKATKEWHKSAYGDNGSAEKAINDYRKALGSPPFPGTK
jgi:hypothetical protein